MEIVEYTPTEHVEEVDLASHRGDLAAALAAAGGDLDRLPAGRLLGLPELPAGDVWVDMAGASALAGVPEKTITSWLSRGAPKQNPFPAASRFLYRLYWPASAILAWKAARAGSEVRG